MQQIKKIGKYVCPMHADVVRDAPGQCPKCGMQLVPSDKTLRAQDKGLGVITWKSYLPLIAIIVLILCISCIGAFFRQGGLSTIFLRQWIIYFMAGFFIVFSIFKLLDLKGFAEGYSTYDLLANKIVAYGYVYPFIELFFGLVMVVGYHTPAVLWAEVVVMSFSGLGVLIKIAKKEKFQCVCLGTVFKVPLTTVTLVEDFGMAFLAVVLMIF